MRYLLISILLMGCLMAQAQKRYKVIGVVLDTARQPVADAYLKIRFGKDSSMAVSNTSGAFSFPNVASDSFLIIATYTGMLELNVLFYRPKDSTTKAIRLVLESAVTEMEGVVVRAVKPIIIKEDTVQYNAAAYKVREGAAVEEMIKKLPGVTVDGNGNVETGGKKVTKVRLNGKDFFGNDAQIALQNLPADIVDNIQIIDDYGDRANRTGVKTGEPSKIININVQKNKNKGNFGNILGAVGSGGRYALTGSYNNFKEERQLSAVGTLNNTNVNVANFGGGGGGGNGITMVHTGAVNYRNNWGKKIQFYGDYNYSDRNTYLESSSISQDFDPNNIRYTQRQSISNNKNWSHRLNVNLEYTIDTANYIKISPNLSLNTSGYQSEGKYETYRSKYGTLNRNVNASVEKSPSFEGSLLYVHRFHKRGRIFSINASSNTSTNQSDRDVNNAYTYLDSTVMPLGRRDTSQVQSIDNWTKNTRTNAHASFIEPLDSKQTTFVEISYDWNKSYNESIRKVFDLVGGQAMLQPAININQSDNFHYDFITQRTGISLRGRKPKYNYSIGVISQPTALSGYSAKRLYNTEYKNMNWLPSARFVYQFSRSNVLTASLDGSAREPSFWQIQPVTDSSNLDNILLGNPNLKNENNNRFALNYNFSNTTGANMYINISYNRTDDKIVTNRANNATGTGRTTSYLNTDGFYGYNANASYTRPFAKRKYFATLNLYANFDNNLSFSDGQKYKGKNLNLRPEANFRVDWRDVMELNARSSFTYYQTETAYKDGTRTSIAKTINVGINGKNYIKRMTIGYSFSKTINYQFNSSVRANPTIINLFAEYRLLKKKNLSVGAQAFDLLNKYTGLTRNIYETTITDTRTNRLGRFFLVSANYRFNHFGGKITKEKKEKATGKPLRKESQ